MLEKTLYDYLNASGTLSVPAYLERPASPPEKFVIIERTGGNRENGIDTATIAIQSIAPSLYEAVQLNEEVIEALFNAPELDEIGGIRLNSYYNFTSREQADRNEYRYQSIFLITHY